MEVRKLSKSFLLSSIYASPKFESRKLLWNDLHDFASTVNLPWIVIGDFNEVVCQSEEFGGRPINRKRMELYAETMNNCNLVDLGFNGSKYTWTNKRIVRPIFERLDRGWVNPEWICTFPNSSIWHLPRITSDHCPILLHLDLNQKILGAKPFRFEPMWILELSFHTFLATEWETIRRGGT